MTVEEVLRAQRDSSNFLLAHRHEMIKDTIMFPDGLPDVDQHAFLMGQAFAYNWSNPITRLVIDSCANYPLDEAIEAIHYFHKPNMFWLFGQSFMTVEAKHEVTGARVTTGLDALTISAWTRGRPSNQALVNRVMRYLGGSPEERAALAEEVRDLTFGVQIIAYHSLRTGIATPMPSPLSGMIPAGARIVVPILSTTIVFGEPVSEFTVDENLKDDPTLVSEQVTLRRFVLAASALIKQRILVPVTQTATRGERKRLGAEATPILTIALRASERQAMTVGQNIVEWSHRWIVRGHWRKQWYPSQHEHRVLWIPSFVKGPEDKPLVIRPEVYAVCR